MQRCLRDHEVPDGQPFCGRCGAPVTAEEHRGEAPDTPANQSTLAPVGPPPDRPINWDRVSQPSFIGRAWHRPAVRAAVAVGGLLVVFVAIGVLTSGDDSGETTTAQPSTSPSTSSTPASRCKADFDRILETATAPGVTNTSAQDFIASQYGWVDPRTDVLIRIYFDLPARRLAVGATQANQEANDRVQAWCDDNAVASGY